MPRRTKLAWNQPLLPDHAQVTGQRQSEPGADGRALDGGHQRDGGVEDPHRLAVEGGRGRREPALVRWGQGRRRSGSPPRRRTNGPPSTPPRRVRRRPSAATASARARSTGSVSRLCGGRCKVTTATSPSWLHRDVAGFGSAPARRPRRAACGSSRDRRGVKGCRVYPRPRRRGRRPFEHGGLGRGDEVVERVVLVEVGEAHTGRRARRLLGQDDGELLEAQLGRGHVRPRAARRGTRRRPSRAMTS